MYSFLPGLFYSSAQVKGNGPSEGREVERACVSRVSGWLVQGQRGRFCKDPQSGPDANPTRDWARLIRNQF